jgi:cytochrome b involved in lipid metabolism
MRSLFIVATVCFWIAVGAIGIVAHTTPADDPPRQPPSATERLITLAELARHATPNDCWMAIDGQVYDVTAYLPDHPSPPELVLPWCGKESSEAYQTKGKERPHTSHADQLLQKYGIGRLVNDTAQGQGSG